MNILRQIGIVSLINFRSLRSRLWRSLVIVVGMACVIGVLLSMLSLTEGMLSAYTKDRRSGPRPGGVGRLAKRRQQLHSRDKARLIMDAPGIAKAAGRLAHGRSRHHSGVPVIRLNGRPAYNSLRGFGPKGVALRPEFHMVSGRMFRPGNRELIVGVGAPRPSSRT